MNPECEQCGEPLDSDGVEVCSVCAFRADLVGGDDD